MDRLTIVAKDSEGLGRISDVLHDLLFELPLGVHPVGEEELSFEFWHPKSFPFGKKEKERYQLEISRVKAIEVIGDPEKGPGGEEMFNDFLIGENGSLLTLKCSMAVKEVRFRVASLQVKLTQLQ